ncbi:hypothetical protein ThrDRAFT_02143 [Frankia casuarinae]|uniref:Uncharacterized protein n=1 Tax=Frankia casuarinae (strain DSM 45818 / CECT 9043 / HFP020203 / CcI3) TaxID=106370 RepID=Q2JFC0_FRACC|nr:hypothetical protein [Frankia casuarinae]ABD10022.1 hypothetical protein Francci3_0638 [Frankia casuarinae]EYT92185.1 hypothetical protein ThrDRAFT_02143 [Frankia casuarinae]
MRLDEHGRWVSDDGAYVWDEAAQTWQPSSAAPPAGSSASARFGNHPGGPAFGAGPAGEPGSGRVGSEVGAQGGSFGGRPGAAGSSPGAGPGAGPGAVEAAPAPPSWGGALTDPPRTMGGVVATPSEPDARGLAPYGPTGQRGRWGEPAADVIAPHGPSERGDLTGPARRAGAADPVDPVAASAGPAAAQTTWGDGDSTGEIRRVGGLAATYAPSAGGAADGTSRWDDDPDDEPGPYAGSFDEHDSGWAPSGPISRRGATARRESTARRGATARRDEAGGLPARVTAFVQHVRDRPPLLIGAAVVLVCLGLGVIGFLALGGGGSDSGTAAGPAAAEKGRYSPEVRQAYLSSCLDVSNGNEGYCTCTLEKLEAGYTQEEYQRFSDNVQSESSQRIVREIYAACRDKR